MISKLNPYEQAFLPILQKNYEIVQFETWGHLALVKNKKYAGSILFAVSEWNSIGACLIKTDFEKTLEDAPWLFNSLNEFISEQDLESGFYKWTGFIKNYKFTGHIVNVSANPPLTVPHK